GPGRLFRLSLLISSWTASLSRGPARGGVAPKELSDGEWDGEARLPEGARRRGGRREPLRLFHAGRRTADPVHDGGRRDRAGGRHVVPHDLPGVPGRVRDGYQDPRRAGEQG